MVHSTDRVPLVNVLEKQKWVSIIRLHIQYIYFQYEVYYQLGRVVTIYVPEYMVFMYK